MSGAGVRLRKDLQLRIHGAFPSAPRFLIFCVSRHSPPNSATDAVQRVLAECWVQTLHVRNEFSLRSLEWWRDLTLGLLLGGSLIWALSDTTFHWETVKTHAFAEVVCVAIPLALALLSPRRVLTVFWGWSLYRKHRYWSLPLRFSRLSRPFKQHDGLIDTMQVHCERKGGKVVKRITEQAQLILRLYELRRETLMREARSFVGGEFLPQTDDELVAILSKGGKESGFVLQVYGYWDMVCAFVRHRMLSEPLVYDTCQEMYFQYAKIQPHLRGFRRKMNLPEWMQSIEKVVEGSAKGKKRLAAMQASLARMRRQKQEKPADQASPTSR